jgi:hydrogenase nickel incorporation protein HypB
MFRTADLLLLTKVDLLAVLDDFDPAAAERHLRHLANPAPVLRVSARKGEGLTAWVDWLEQRLAVQRARLQDGQTTLPAMQPDGIRWHGMDGEHAHGHGPHVHDHAHHHHHAHDSHHHSHRHAQDHDPAQAWSSPHSDHPERR